MLWCRSSKRRGPDHAADRSGDKARVKPVSGEDGSKQNRLTRHCKAPTVARCLTQHRRFAIEVVSDSNTDRFMHLQIGYDFECKELHRRRLAAHL
jgi:hypothetical protein